MTYEDTTKFCKPFLVKDVNKTLVWGVQTLCSRYVIDVSECAVVITVRRTHGLQSPYTECTAQEIAALLENTVGKCVCNCTV